MTNVDCHFYVEVFESEDGNDPIAISSIFSFPDDDTDSEVFANAMDRYIEGISDGLGVLPVYYKLFRVRGDGVKKFQYAGTIVADEPEDAQDDEEESGEDIEEEEPAPEEEYTEEEPEAEDDTAEEETEEEPEEETDEEPEDDAEEEEPEEDTEEEPEEETDEEPEDDAEEEDTEEEEDDWPWLTELDGEPASKKNANKFMLGAIMNYWMKPEVSWDNTEILAEEILKDPDDLWGVLADMSDDEIKKLFTGPPALHRFLKKMPEMVLEVAINMDKMHDGDSRNIWTDQTIGDILQRLHDVGVKKQTSALIVWALRESGQIKV